MNGFMSDWEVRRFRDEKVQRAIGEAEQDRLAQEGRPSDRSHSGGWLVIALVSALRAIGVWLMHGQPGISMSWAESVVATVAGHFSGCRST